MRPRSQFPRKISPCPLHRSTRMREPHGCLLRPALIPRHHPSARSRPMWQRAMQQSDAPRGSTLPPHGFVLPGQPSNMPWITHFDPDPPEQKSAFARGLIAAVIVCVLLAPVVWFGLHRYVWHGSSLGPANSVASNPISAPPDAAATNPASPAPDLPNPADANSAAANPVDTKSATAANPAPPTEQIPRRKHLPQCLLQRPRQILPPTPSRNPRKLPQQMPNQRRSLRLRLRSPANRRNRRQRDRPSQQAVRATSRRIRSPWHRSARPRLLLRQLPRRKIPANLN